MSNTRKTDGTADRSYEIRWRERNTERGGKAERIMQGERLGLSLCAVPSPRRMWGLSIYGRDKGLRSNEGIRNRVVMQARRQIRTEYLRQVEGQVTGGLV